jgi:hypothetical protein
VKYSYIADGHKKNNYSNISDDLSLKEMKNDFFLSLIIFMCFDYKLNILLIIKRNTINKKNKT